MPEQSLESMPAPPKRKSPAKPAGSFSEMNRKLAVAEDRIERIREHLSLVENNFLKGIKELKVEVHEYDEKIDELKKEIQRLEGMIERVVSKLEMFASKEQMKVLERYLNFWNPLDYVSKKDVEELIDKKLKKKKKK